MKNSKKSDLIINNWQASQQQVFEQLINTFITAPVLCHYNPDHKLHMKMNASGSAYADILSQQWRDRWHSITYFSKDFSGPELSYSIYNKKLMTIVMSFRQWQHYLENATEIEY
jgi:hypothetical protein